MRCDVAIVGGGPGGQDVVSGVATHGQSEAQGRDDEVQQEG